MAALISAVSPTLFSASTLAPLPSRTLARRWRASGEGRLQASMRAGSLVECEELALGSAPEDSSLRTTYRKSVEMLAQLKARNTWTNAYSEGTFSHHVSLCSSNT